MRYASDDSIARVDFFRQSGKWYTTEEMKWDRYLSEDKDGKVVELITDTFKRCIDEQFPDHFIEMIAVCLEPYHEHSHPLMFNRLTDRLKIKQT